MTEVDAALALCRTLHYAAALVIFGALVFEILAPHELSPVLGPLCRRIVVAGAVLALPTTVCWLMLQSIAVADDWAAALDPRAIGTVLLHTDFGRVWQIHLAVAAGLLIALVLPPRPRQPVLLALSTLYLSGLAFIGHAVMREGAAGWMLRFSHVAHLFAAGFWLGSLPLLLACVRAMREDAMRAAALSALQRFSMIGQLAVVALVASGIVNAWLILGNSGARPAAPYISILGLKLALVTAMLALAITNRLVVVPQLAKPDMRRQLRLDIVGEIALGYAVVATIGLAGMLSPSS